MAALQSAGIRTLADLVERLKTKKRVHDVARETDLTSDYLVILRRQALSYLPKPVSLARFPGVCPDVVTVLKSCGINHGKQLLERTATAADRARFAAEVGIDSSVLLDLVKMANLTRISGIGPTFARLLVSMDIKGLSQLFAKGC